MKNISFIAELNLKHRAL